MTRSIGTSMLRLLALTLLATMIGLFEVSANPINEPPAPSYPGDTGDPSASSTDIIKRVDKGNQPSPFPYPKTCPPPQYDRIDRSTFAPRGVTCTIPELSVRHPCANFPLSRDQVANIFFFGKLKYSTDGGYVFVDSSNNTHCVTKPVNGFLGPFVLATVFGHWSDGRDKYGRCRRTIVWAAEKGVAVEVTIDGIKFHGICR